MEHKQHHTHHANKPSDQQVKHRHYMPEKTTPNRKSTIMVAMNAQLPDGGLKITKYTLLHIYELDTTTSKI